MTEQCCGQQGYWVDGDEEWRCSQCGRIINNYDNNNAHIK